MSCIELFSNKLRVFGKSQEMREDTSDVIKNSEAIERICSNKNAIRDVYEKKLYINENGFCKIVEEENPVVYSFTEGKKIIFITNQEMFVLSKFKKNKDGSRLSSGIRYSISEIDNNSLFYEPINVSLIKNNYILAHSRENLKKSKNQNLFVEKYQKLNEGKLKPVSFLTKE